MTPEELPKMDPKNLQKYTPDPDLFGLPAQLKDPANYEYIQKTLIHALRSTCDHSDVGEWEKCFKCQQKVIDHKNTMIRLGFKSPLQYRKWKKIMNHIMSGKRDPVNKSLTS